jgi:hypothetical protein
VTLTLLMSPTLMRATFQSDQPKVPHFDGWRPQ